MSVNDIQYSYADPEQIKASYGEYDVVDFMINTDRNLQVGSVRIEGDLFVSQDGTARCDNNSHCYYNFRTGIGGVVENISTQLGGSGDVVEFLQNYNRLNNMKETATKDTPDYFNGLDLCELKVPSPDQARQVVRGKPLQDSGNTFIDNDFSFVPQFCLNKANSQSISLVPFNNLIKVSVSLARNWAFLSGTGVVANSKYEIKNLRMTYRTLPPQPTPNVSCKSYVSLKQTLQSNNISVNTRVPAIASGVSVSFLQQGKENTALDNNDLLQRPPAPVELRWAFNNASSNYITYSILDIGEMLELGLNSLGGGYGKGHNQVQPQNSGGQNAFIIGADFNGNVDLRNQKFTMELRSSITQAQPMICWMFFHNIIQLGQ